MQKLSTAIVLALALAACAPPQPGLLPSAPECRQRFAARGLDSARLAAGLQGADVDRQPRLYEAGGYAQALAAESRALGRIPFRPVGVRARVLADGSADSVHVPPYTLDPPAPPAPQVDSAAVRVMRAARFAPAVVDGCRVPAWTTVIILFGQM